MGTRGQRIILVAVVLVLAGVGTLAIVGNAYSQRTRCRLGLIHPILDIQYAIDAYRVDNYCFPPDDGGQCRTSRSLYNALMSDPETKAQIEALPEKMRTGGCFRDCWGRELGYKRDGKKGEPDLVSAGEDGVFGTGDDFILSDMRRTGKP